MEKGNCIICEEWKIDVQKIRDPKTNEMEYHCEECYDKKLKGLK